MNSDCNNPDDLITSLPFSGVDEEGNRYFEDSDITYIVRTDPFLVNCIGTESLNMYIASKSSRIDQAMYKVKNDVRLSAEPVFQNPFDGNSYFDKSLLVYKDRAMLYMYETDLCEVGYGEEIVRGNEKPIYSLIPFSIDGPSILGLSVGEKSTLVDLLKGVNVAENEQKVLEVLRRNPDYVQREEADVNRRNAERVEWVPPAGGNVLDAVNADIDEYIQGIIDEIPIEEEYRIENSIDEVIVIPRGVRILGLYNCPNVREISGGRNLDIIRAVNCPQLRTIHDNMLDTVYVQNCNNLDFTDEWVNRIQGTLICDRVTIPVDLRCSSIRTLVIRNSNDLIGINCPRVRILRVDNSNFAEAVRGIIEVPRLEEFTLRRCNLRVLFFDNEDRHTTITGEIIECPKLARVGGGVIFDNFGDKQGMLKDGGYDGIIYY